MIYRLAYKVVANSELAIKEFVSKIPLNGTLEIQPSANYKHSHSLAQTLVAVRNLKAGRSIKLTLTLTQSAQARHELKEIAQNIQPGVMVYLSDRFPLKGGKQILNEYLDPNCVMCITSLFNRHIEFLRQIKPTRLLKLHGWLDDVYIKYSGNLENPIEWVTGVDPLVEQFRSFITLQDETDLHLNDATTTNVWSLCNFNSKNITLIPETPQTQYIPSSLEETTTDALSNVFDEPALPAYDPSFEQNLFLDISNTVSSSNVDNSTSSSQFTSIPTLYGEPLNPLPGDIYTLDLSIIKVDRLLAELPHLNKYVVFTITGGEIEDIDKFIRALPPQQIIDLTDLPTHLQLHVDTFIQHLNVDTFLLYKPYMNVNLDSNQHILNSLPNKVRLVHNNPCFRPGLGLGQKVITLKMLGELYTAARNNAEAQPAKVLLNQYSPFARLQSLLPKQSISVVEDLIPEQIEAIPEKIKKIFGGFNLSINTLTEFAKKNIQVIYPKAIGISDKYLPFHMPSLLPNINEKANPESIKKANDDVPTSYVPHTELQQLFNQSHGQTHSFSHHTKIHYPDITLDYYAYQPLSALDKTVTFIFSGRKEKALIPASNETPIVLVITQEEFKYYSEQYSMPSQKNIGILVVGHIHKPYKNEVDPTHTISSRRYACLYFCYEMDLAKAFMYDDNIEKIFSNEDLYSDTQAQNPNLDYVIEQLNEELERYGALFLSISSKAHIDKFSEGKYGSKAHLWDIENIRHHLNSKEEFLALMPESATAWGQVVFAQVLLDTLLPGQQATRIVSRTMLQLQRSTSNKNATKNLGVVAKPLEFSENHKIHLRNREVSSESINKIEMAYWHFNQMVQSTIQSQQKRLEALQSMDLELVHAQRNGLIPQSMPPITSNGEFSTIFRDNLLQLLHQEEAIKAQMEWFQPHEHQWQSFEFLYECLNDPTFSHALFDIATGCGKTFIQAIMAFTALASTNKSIVVVCPYRHLTEQTYDAFLSYLKQFPFLSSVLHISDSKMLKIFSGSERAFSQELITQNNCQNPRYLFMTCEESYYQLLKNENFKNNIALTIFDESHLTVHEKPSEASSSSNSALMTLHFTATPKSSPLHTFEYTREMGIEKGLLSPLLVDTLPADLTPDDLTQDQILHLLENHKEPSGQNLMYSKGIIFVKNQKQAKELTLLIKAKYPTYNCFQISSDNNDRLKDINQFKKTSNAIGIAVNMLVEGFDDSALRWVLLLRKTDEIRLSQIVGRLLRRDHTSPDKIGLMIASRDVQQASIFPAHMQPPSNTPSVAKTLRQYHSQESIHSMPVHNLVAHGVFSSVKTIGSTSIPAGSVSHQAQDSTPINEPRSKRPRLMDG